MKEVHIGNCWYVNYPLWLILIELPFNLIGICVGWLEDNIRFYSLHTNGKCQHGYFVRRKVVKHPFGKPKFTDITNCPLHIDGETILGYR